MIVSKNSSVILILALTVATVLRLCAAAIFDGFHTGDDVEILSEAFKKALGLQYEPWVIRNVFLSEIIVSPFVWLASLLGVEQIKLLIWAANIPFVILASVNMLLVYKISMVSAGDEKASVLASAGYGFHWLPLGYGSTVYPRTVSTFCILLAVSLCLRRNKIRMITAGVLMAIAFATRYSEVIFLLPLAILIFLIYQDVRISMVSFAYLMLGFVAGVIVCVGLMDFLSWGKPFSSLVSFAQFTLVEKKSSSIITSQPPLWYLSKITNWLPLTLLPFLWISTRSKSCRFAWYFVLLPLALLSMIHHKEFRYLQGIIPFLFILAAHGTIKLCNLNYRRTAIALLTISFLWGLHGLKFLPKKSMSAVEGARFLLTIPSVRSVALSQSWAYGGHLYFGNNIVIHDLPVPPIAEDIRAIRNRVDYVGVYEEHLKSDPRLRSELVNSGFRPLHIFHKYKSKGVVIFSRLG